MLKASEISLVSSGRRASFARTAYSSLLLFAAAMTATGQESRSPAQAVEFFQKNVRPVLVQNCLNCHGPDKKKGDLDLSRRDHLLEGGANGPAIVPGKAGESLLFQKVAAGKMPPKETLTKDQIAAIRKWIDEGAVFDKEPLIIAARKGIEVPWSFKPVARPDIPATPFDVLSNNPVDRFLFQKLAKKNLKPSPPAERLALLRRVTFDLAGLPPTPGEVDAFLTDRSAVAYEKVVDRLLASPAYGERWARHWLDVVRFGESNGYEQNHLRPNAWPYRDYVIRAFNEDRPFDRFIAEQLAGDVLSKGDPHIEAATGFLVAGVHDTVGNQTEEGTRQQRANDLDDIVSTVGAAFLGLTVNCAKCHDHKFDPISQKDFYALNAIFAGVRHGERPWGPSARSAKDNPSEVQGRLRNLRGQLDDLEAKARFRVLAEQGVKKAPRPAVNTRRNVEDFPPVEARFVRFTIEATKDGSEPCLDELEIYGPEATANLALASAGAKATASSLLPGYKIHQVAHLNDGRLGNDWSWISKEPGLGWAQIELAKPARLSRIVWSRDGNETPQFRDRLAVKYRIETSMDGKTWRPIIDGGDRAEAVEAITVERLTQSLHPEERQERLRLLDELERARPQPDQRPPTAYLGQFTAPDTIHFLKRGDVMQRGDVIVPAALTQLSGPLLDAELVKTEPGRRLALAKWITHAANPLTARVLVNRVWQYHFGRGLAATPSDFGNQGGNPSHPELLDWLAHDFVAGGWKLKRLHKLLVTSYAYRQSSQANAEGQTVDADNQFVWRMPLRRLEAETLRDSILAVSGKLKRTMGGPGFLLFKYRVVNVGIYEPLEEHGPETWRRAVYAASVRAIREDLLASFDCPECAQRTPRREVTTTPLQALSLLNGAFTTQQARFFTQRVERESGSDRSEQVKIAFRLAFGRSPTTEEIQVSGRIIERHGLETLCRALLNANEFLYY